MLVTHSYKRQHRTEKALTLKSDAPAFPSWLCDFSVAQPWAIHLLLMPQFLDRQQKDKNVEPPRVVNYPDTWKKGGLNTC